MESFRRDLLNDMAEHIPILKNNQNTYHPRFIFAPKTGIELPKTGVPFDIYRFIPPKIDQETRLRLVSSLFEITTTQIRYFCDQEQKR